MAKVKIQGHASGTGVITVTAPNTSTDRTITLPDSTGELLSTAGGTMTGDLTIGSVGSVTSSGSDLKISGTDDIFFNVAGASDNILQLYGNNSTNVNTQTKVASPVYPFADNSYDLGNSSERWKDLYLSGGLKVGGTGAANTLDDYEEGTWTPTITRNSSAPSVTYTGQIGTYTKIGNIVTIYADINWSNMTGGSGGARVVLPFTAMSSRYFKPETRSYTGLSVGVDYTPSGYTSGANLEIQRISQSGGNEGSTDWNGSGRYNFQITILV